MKGWRFATLRLVAVWLVFDAVAVAVKAAKSSDKTPMKDAVNNKPLEFASPLQTLTFFPSTTTTSTATTSIQTSPRKAFLPKLAAGLSAERRIKDKLTAERKDSLLASLDDDNYSTTTTTSTDNSYTNDWDQRSEKAERQRLQMEELRMERAFDRAVAKYQHNEAQPSDTTPTSPHTTNTNTNYQFVGVINHHDTSNDDNKDKQQTIQWYARKKKQPNSWNVRLVHVNKDALLRDLFVRGKLDVYAEYQNTGTFLTKDAQDQQPQYGQPLLQPKYSVKPRSWRNLWNFSPKHLFSDSSGSFWRERRLSPGLYTDGRLVYESTYRYSDGKNGMKPISTLDAFMKSRSITTDVKKNLIKRLKNDSPDVVVEE